MVKKVKKKVVEKSKEDQFDQYEKENSENEGFGLGKYINLKTKESSKNAKKKLKHTCKALTNKDNS